MFQLLIASLMSAVLAQPADSTQNASEPSHSTPNVAMWLAPRTLWEYQGGYIQNIGGGTWIERKAGYSATFQEVYRNAYFIELRESGGGTGYLVRLYATEGYTKDPWDPAFRFWTYGRWR